MNAALSPDPARPAESRSALVWVGALIAGILILFAGAIAVSWTIPFQEWDAYSAGTWSTLISQGSPLFPPEIDQILKQRPVVFVVQGLIWRALGHQSMRAGRLYSLLFSVLLVWSTYLVAQTLGRNRSRAILAAFLVAASPVVTEQVSSTLTDIPSAALVWLGYWALLRGSTSPLSSRRTLWWLGSGTLFAGALLAKVTVAPMILGLVAIEAVRALSRTGARRTGIDLAVLAVPAGLVILYFDRIRAGAPWSYFLFGWAGPYYSTLAVKYRVPNLKQVQWFGVFLSAALVIALASRASQWLRRRKQKESVAATAAAVVVFALAALYVCVGTRGLTAPLRPYDSPDWDRWVAGVIPLAALLAIGFVAARSSRGATTTAPFSGALLPLAGLFWLLWWWKLGYNRRFLVVVLPVVALLVADWLSDVLRSATSERSERVVTGCALAVMLAAGWEGGRRMDHAYPVFSKHLIEINRKDGLQPEAKLADIFGEDAKVLARLQEMTRAEPGLRLALVSRDNWLRFYLGKNATIERPVSSRELDRFDYLVWCDHESIRQEYAQTFHLIDPVGNLNAEGRLTLLFSGGHYRVFRIR
jgi:hypothetical protein